MHYYLIMIRVEAVESSERDFKPVAIFHLQVILRSGGYMYNNIISYGIRQKLAKTIFLYHIPKSTLRINQLGFPTDFGIIIKYKSEAGETPWKLNYLKLLFHSSGEHNINEG